ncbi:uncharacterized protein N7469_002571 [Penicillium citrinum]|uniref:MARVEL domain-containing protein n=2 Tax=Penicillium TaxID=5073 RepID=A0A9W9PAP9_PENCI|nr:uncharacterized protein N7469_002571 [Penicillium citrinum]KAJ5240980.1 hypothetical protein N7469_002571 [Penicillium citrinum]KAJ5585978.1 hypothetical protein N7450_005765 [Penicillium hetheringtonii]KAK5789602.1 hypothetical protein VI817_008725 [Penicillium citrinum]
MSFIFLKVLELGYNRHKKNKAAKKAQKEAELYGQQPPYPTNTYPNQPYPMSEYPPNIGPGTDTRFSQPPGTPQSKRAKLAYMLVSAIRFFQFVFGLTVIGLYGRDVRHDHKYKDTWNSKWIYALVTGGLATITAIIHLVIPFLMRRSGSASARAGSSNPALQLPQFGWEFVLCVLWLTLFGLFGKMYIGVYPEKKGEGDLKESGLGDSGRIDRMRHACWIDLINLLLWVFTSSWILLKWLKARRQAGTSVDAEKADEGSI